MDTLNTHSMTDEQIDAALGLDDLDTVEDLPVEQDEADEAGEAVEQADATTQAEQDQQQEQQQEQAADWNPDGPGDVKEALRQSRENEKALKQQLAEIHQWRQQQEQAAYQHQAQAEEAQRQADRRAQLEEAAFEPERQEQLLNQWRQEDAQRIHHQATQYHVQALYQQGFEIGREAFSDFDTVLNRGLADPELAPVLEAVSQRALAEGKNPVVAAYKTAKRLDPASVEDRIKAEVNRQVQEVLQKQQKPATAGATTIAHASSAAPGLPQAKPTRRLSDKELDAKLAEQAG